MSQKKKNSGSLYFLIITLLTVVVTACAIFILRAIDGAATSVEPTASSEWCNELEEGDCFPATCRARAHTVVVFHADWCPWCRKLEREVLTDPSVIDALKVFGKVSVDTEENTDTSAAYEITGIPTIVLLDRDCRETLRIRGFVDAETLLRELDGL